MAVAECELEKLFLDEKTIFFHKELKFVKRKSQEMMRNKKMKMFYFASF
jgi:hypothetical protein